MTSIYLMTVGELAKKRGQPVGEFVKRLQDLGLDIGSHAKKLTQPALDEIIGLLEDGNKAPATTTVKAKNAEAVNPNVLIIKTQGNSSVVALVDATLNEDGTISVRVVESSVETSLGETLLEYRKQQGMKMGVN